MPDSGKDDAMFNLEKAVEEWRRWMVTGGIEEREVLEELESHLRDDVEQRVRQGLSEEAAFSAAVEALGQTPALKQEFAKILRPVAKYSPATLFIRWCCWGSAAFVGALGVWTVSHLEMSAASSLRLAAILLAVLYFLKLPFVYQRLRTMSSPVSRECVRFLSILAWPVWVYSAPPASTAFYLILLAFASIIPALVLAASFRLDEETGRPSFLSAALANLDEAAALSLESAQLEAARLHHDFVGTEHLLLALLRAEGSVVADAMRRRGVTAQVVTIAIEREIGIGRAGPVSQNLPRTPRANRALELAAKEASAANRPVVTSEYLFLGLLLEGTGVAARVLVRLGVDPEEVRKEIQS